MKKTSNLNNILAVGLIIDDLKNPLTNKERFPVKFIKQMLQFRAIPFYINFTRLNSKDDSSGK